MAIAHSAKEKNKVNPKFCQTKPKFTQTFPKQNPNKFLYLGFGFCAITQQECTLQFEKM